MPIVERAGVAATIHSVNVSRRLLFAVLCVAFFAALSWVLIIPTATWLGPYSITVALFGFTLAGWIAAMPSRKIAGIPPRASPMIAIVAAHALYIVAVTVVVYAVSSNQVAKWVLLAAGPMELPVFVAATYWQASARVRAIETRAAIATWVAFCILRATGLWFFAPKGPDMNDVERFRMAGWVLPAAAAPLLVGLVAEFRRHRA